MSKIRSNATLGLFHANAVRNSCNCLTNHIALERKNASHWYPHLFVRARLCTFGFVILSLLSVLRCGAFFALARNVDKIAQDSREKPPVCVYLSTGSLLLRVKKKTSRALDLFEDGGGRATLYSTQYVPERG